MFGMRRLSEAGLSTGEPPAKAGAAAHRSCLTSETSQAVVPQPSSGQDALQSPTLLG